MPILNSESLSFTLEAVTEALFEGRAIEQSERENITLWLARRQGQPGSYHGFSAPTMLDFHESHLYTGEMLNSRASTAHILGEEAARCLAQLNVQHPEVKQAMNRNIEIIENFDTFRYGHRSFYCCTRCTIAYWRFLNVTGMPEADDFLRKGINILSQSREGNGRWRSFPFFYTLFTLLDLDINEANQELHHSLPACERTVKRMIKADDRFAERQKKIAQSVLEKYS